MRLMKHHHRHQRRGTLTLYGFYSFGVMELALYPEARFADAYAALRTLHIFGLRKYLVCRPV